MNVASERSGRRYQFWLRGTPPVICRHLGYRVIESFMDLPEQPQGQRQRIKPLKAMSSALT